MCAIISQFAITQIKFLSQTGFLNNAEFQVLLIEWLDMVIFKRNHFITGFINDSPFVIRMFQGTWLTFLYAGKSSVKPIYIIIPAKRNYNTSVF